MEHFIAITDPIDGVVFAIAPPIEREDSCYMGYVQDYAQPIPAAHAGRTFDWAYDDAATYADGTCQPHQVWHIVDGKVIDYVRHTN